MLIPVVNEHDEFIENKERESVDSSREIHRITGLWLTNSKGQVLLAQRARTKKHDPGKWGPAAAGTVEAGETYESNVYKEAEEEIGLTGAPLKATVKIRYAPPDSCFCQWYYGQVDWPIEAFTLQSSEVAAVAWVDLEQLKRDSQANPDEYLPNMPLVIERLADITGDARHQ